MTTDYLKQLQLTKQLEQKAREAARIHRTSEERLTEAQCALDRAREDGLPLAEAEAAHAEAANAFARRDYPTVLACSARCLELLAGQRRTCIQEFLDAARAAIAPIPKAESDAELTSLFDETAAMCEQGHLEKAQSLAEQARDRAERYADRCLHERMERARELILLTERLGLNGEGEDILSSAENMREGEDRADKWRQLDACMDLLHGIFSEHFDSHREIIDNIVAKGDAANVDLLPLTRMLREGQAALELGDYETSINLIEQAMKEKDSIISMAVQERLAALQEECTILEEWGADLCTFKEAALLVEGEEGECTLPPLLQASEALREARVSVVLQAINDIRPRLLLARRLQLDISPILARLEGIRETAGEDLDSALAGVAAAEELTDAALWGHAELAEELQRTMELFLSARQVGISPGPAGALVTESRLCAIAGEIETAHNRMVDARESVYCALQDAGTRKGLSALSILSEAMAIGADVEEEGAKLMRVLEELRRGEVNGTVAELCRITNILREESERTAHAWVDHAAEVLSYSSIDFSDLTERLEEAGDLATRGEALSAALLSEDIVAEGRSRQSAMIRKLSNRIRRLMDICRQMGDDPFALDPLAFERSSEPEETIYFLEGALQDLRAFVRGKLGTYMVQLSRSMIEARKKDISIINVQKIADEANRKLKSGDVEMGFAGLRHAEAELETTIALHAEVHGQMISLSRLMDEVELPPGSSAREHFEETERLFEQGMYNKAQATSQACLREIETVAAAALAPRRLQECQDLAALTEQMEMDAKTLKSAIQKAENHVRNGLAEEALSTLREGWDSGIQTIQEGLGEQIEIVTRRLAWARRLGSDVKEAQKILAEADPLLEERRYLDTFKTIRLAAAEGDRSMAHVYIAHEEVARAASMLEDAVEFGIDTKEASTLLAQARKDLREEKISMAQEKARGAQEIIHRAASDMLSRSIDKLEREHDAPALRGEDLGRTGHEPQAVLKILKEGGLYQAIWEMERYERALLEVGGSRSQASTILDQVRSCPTSSAMAPILPAAEAAFSRGAFEECTALLRTAERERAALEALQGRRRAILSKLRKQVEREGQTIATEALLDEMSGAAPVQFWKLHREVLSLLDREATEERQEKAAGLIDALRALLILESDDLPPAARRLLSCPISQLDADDLNLSFQMREEAEQAIQRAMRSAREAQHCMDATRSALVGASTLLSSGFLTLSASMAREAQHALGWTMGQRREMWGEHHELLARVKAAEEQGADGKTARALLARAIIATPQEARDIMTAARAQVEAEERAIFPVIHLEAERMVEGEGKWKTVEISLINDGGTAVDLRAEAEGGELRGALPRVLTPGQRKVSLDIRGTDSIRLSYRPLFSRDEKTLIMTLE